MSSDLMSWLIAVGWVLFLAWALRRICRWAFAPAESDAEIAVLRAEFEGAVQRNDTAYADQVEAMLRDRGVTGLRG
jgi:hypothetical protein